MRRPPTARPDRRTLVAAAVATLAVTLAPGAAGCPRRKAADAAGSSAPPPAAPAVAPPPWREVAPLGRVALELPGALIPRGADALVPGAPGQTIVFALKRDYASSALHHVDFSSPAAPTVAAPLVFHGPASELVRLGPFVAVATLEAGRPPELCLVRGGSPPRVVARVKLDAPMLGPIAASGAAVYLATAAGVEGIVEGGAPLVVAYRLEDPSAETPKLVSLGAQTLPAPARSIAVAGDRLVIAVEAAPPIWSAPLAADGRPGALAWSLDYQIVQPLESGKGPGEYAFEAAPRMLVAAGPRLAVAADPHTTYVAIRIADPPRLAFPPAFHHSRGGGLLAVDPATPAAVPGALVSLFRLKGQRIYADALDAEGRPTPLDRLRLPLLGSGRALALVPGLLLVSDESFGLYLFPR